MSLRFTSILKVFPAIWTYFFFLSVFSLAFGACRKTPSRTMNKPVVSSEELIGALEVPACSKTTADLAADLRGLSWRACANALLEFGRRREAEHLSGMTPLLEDPNPKTRANCLWALSEITGLPVYLKPDWFASRINFALRDSLEKNKKLDWKQWGIPQLGQEQMSVLLQLDLIREPARFEENVGIGVFGGEDVLVCSIRNCWDKTLYLQFNQAKNLEWFEYDAMGGEFRFQLPESEFCRIAPFVSVDSEGLTDRNRILKRGQPQWIKDVQSLVVIEPGDTVEIKCQLLRDMKLDSRESWLYQEQCVKCEISDLIVLSDHVCLGKGSLTSNELCYSMYRDLHDTALLKKPDYQKTLLAKSDYGGIHQACKILEAENLKTFLGFMVDSMDQKLTFAWNQFLADRMGEFLPFKCLLGEKTWEEDIKAFQKEFVSKKDVLVWVVDKRRFEQKK